MDRLTGMGRCDAGRSRQDDISELGVENAADADGGGPCKWLGPRRWRVQM
jgi:hypothetical protein